MRKGIIFADLNTIIIMVTNGGGRNFDLSEVILVVPKMSQRWNVHELYSVILSFENTCF